MLSRGPRRARCLPVELARWSRSNSTIPTPHPPPARPPLAPTTFSDKSAPRPVYERPEQIRGMPPNSAPSFAKPHVTSATVEGAIPTPDASAAGEKTVKEVMAESFSGPSRPRMVYPLPPKKPRDLPKLGANLPLYILMGILGVSGWGLFLLYATNAERLATSVMRSLQFHLRHSPEVAAALGSRVRLDEPPWVVGDPWISGSVNTMQGRVDVSFRVRGDDGSGTVYFTSIRPHLGDPWRILRYKLITDSGETLRLEDTIERIPDDTQQLGQLASS